MKKLIFFLMLFILSFTTIFAQDVIQIGDESDWSGLFPFTSEYDYGWSTYILTPEQIGNSIEITEIQLNVANYPENFTMENQKLYLKHTTSSIGYSYLRNFLDTDPALSTLVFEGSITWNGNGWQGITLDTSFKYDGYHNIQFIWVNYDGSGEQVLPRFKQADTDNTISRSCYSNYSDLVYSHASTTGAFPLTRLIGNISDPIISAISPATETLNGSVTTLYLEVDSIFTNYDLYIGSNSNTETTLTSFNTVTNPITYAFSVELDYLSTYYWKVLLYDEDNESTELLYTFTTKPDMDGLGTSNSPYLVSTLSDLANMSSDQYFMDKYFIQITNIDASDTRNWNDGAGFNPIGNSSHEFRGSYNGQDYTISNLYINRPDTDNIGLFGYTQGATISNVGIVDNEIYGADRVGGLVGCSQKYDDRQSIISNSYSSGTISGINQVGGLVGRVQRSIISNSSATGTVSGLSISIGGLVGYLVYSSINNSYAYGQVNGVEEVGGLVGYSVDSTISNSYATGATSGSRYVGGLVGYCDTYSTSSTIGNCYATGAVSGINYIGGLVGSRENTSSVNDSFWDMNTSNQAWSDGGTGLTTVAMQTLSTYINAGWDFTNETNNGIEDHWRYRDSHYPFLSWDDILLAYFTVPQTDNSTKTEIMFTNLSNGNLTLSEWDFQNDGIIDSNDTNPVCVYDSIGVYSVKLTVYNDDGEWDTILRTNYINVNNNAPSLTSPIPNIVMDEDTINQELDLRGYFSDVDGDSLVFGVLEENNIKVSFSNGIVYIEPDPDWFGIEELTFTASDSCLAIASDVITVTVENIPDAPRFLNLPESIAILQTTYKIIDFANHLYDPEQELSELSLSITNNDQVTYDISALEVTFFAPDEWLGIDTLTVTVNDNTGRLVNSQDIEIHITDSFVAQFNASKTDVLSGETIYFTDLTFGNPNTWNWYLNNDNVIDSFEQNPSFVYSTAGIFSISLVVSYIDDEDMLVETDSIEFQDFLTVVGTSIEEGSVVGDWDVDGSPYNVFGQISIEPGTSLTIEEGTEINFMEDSEFIVSGDLIANNVTFNRPTDESREVNQWKGLKFTSSAGNSNVTNSFIKNATKPIEINDSAPSLSGITIEGLDSEFPAVKITGSSQAILNDFDIDNYNTGIEILGDSSDDVPIITNIRVRHTTNTRTETNNQVAVKVINSNLTISHLDIEDFAKGIKLESTLGSSTPTLTNIRVRHTTNTRTNGDSYAIKVEGSCSPTIHEVDIEEFSKGIVFDALNSSSTPILTNIRVRHTTNTRELGGTGVEFIGSINVEIDSLVIDDYTTGLSFDNSSRAESSTPTLTNIRIRHTTNTRTDALAFKSIGKVNFNMTDFESENVEDGINLYSDEETTPIITNIRVRHTTNTRNTGVGITLSGQANARISYSEVENFNTGLKVSGNNKAIVERNTFIDNFNAVEISGEECLPQIHHNHLENQLEGLATCFVISGNQEIQILNNNILGYNRIVTGQNSTPYLSQNIIWDASISLADLVSGNQVNAIFEYNNISMATGLAPGLANINVDPLFVDTSVYDLILTLNSECIDGGNPNLPHDPDGSIADIGMNYFHHLAKFNPTNAVVNSGSSIQFDNLSEGHQDASTSILWNFGDGQTSTSREADHSYEEAGVFTVTLTMTSGSYTDVFSRGGFVVRDQEDLEAPQEPELSVTDSSISLTWNEVSSSQTGINIVYLIYSCDDPEGGYGYRDSVTGLTWTDLNIAQQPGRQFYIILGIDSSYRSLTEFINTHRYITRKGELVKTEMISKP